MRLQDFKRRWARQCLAIPRFCRQSLDLDLHGARLVVAYSTGLDSTALLHLLHALAPSLKLTLVAAHAHHGLRHESEAELLQALDTCAGLGIVCETKHLQVREHARSGLEEAARDLRYAFLETVRIRHQADWIVTAHHADDLAEDIILRLIRGTGWPGLGGMTGLDRERRLLRPILNWSKTELRALLEDCGIPWCDDLSNLNTDQTRNRVRHQILPLLQRENPAFSKAALHLWTLARIDRQYWSEQCALRVEDQEHFLDAHSLAGHQALRLRLYKAVLDALGPGQARGDHLLRLDLAWTEGKIGHCIQFPGNKLARVKSMGILFCRQQG